MELQVMPTKMLFDVRDGLQRATPLQAERILFHADAETDVPTLALAYLGHPAFRLWYIPVSYALMVEQCAADIVARFKTESEPADHYSLVDATDYLVEEAGGYLGYLAMVGPVMCALSIGSPLEGWGQHHGVGTQIVRYLQRHYARSGLFALNVTGGQALLSRCGFTTLKVPNWVKNTAYDERPFMAWRMTPAQIALTMRRYHINWEQSG